MKIKNLKKKKENQKYHVANYKVQVCSANYILFYSLVNTKKRMVKCIDLS